MTAPQRVHLNFVGCRLNEAEIEGIARQFAARGADVVPDAPQADLVVINTCAVTQGAVRNSRQMLLQAGRANPNARIIATGCYAEIDPAAVSALPGVAQVIDNAAKDRLVEIVAPDSIPLYEREPIQRETLSPGTLGRTRAFIKAQDGCDNRCAFCVTTLARGAGRSRAAREIIDEINTLAGSGYHEAVLTGVHLGSYGHDLGNPDGLRHLVKTLLAETDIPRLRLSSLEPWDLDAAFFDLWANPRLCPHIHLPLQSGCDATLRRMARRASQKSFAALVEAARQRIADLTITGDLMVGFPGETDSEFVESVAFVEQMAFARLHVFAYSRRPGTAAAGMRGQVAETVKKERSARATKLSARLWESWQARHVGRTFDALWESAHGASPDGFIWSGLTGNYLRVFTTSRETLQNSITSVRLDRLDNGRLIAMPVCVASIDIPHKV